MSLDQKAYRVRTSSALVRRACTLALEPDSYPLAVGYWLLFRQFHHKDTKNTKLGTNYRFCFQSRFATVRQLASALAFVFFVSLW